MEHVYRHAGGRDEAVAIACHECGMADSRDECKKFCESECRKMACFETQVAVGTFTAMDTKIKIKGGNYRWTDTGDGYFTVHDVPLLCEIQKGTKGAPYDVTKDVLDEFLATAQRRYQDGHFCATAFLGHNPDIPITHPEFVGYVLPNRVGKCQMESGEKWTLYGDVKMSSEKFETAKQGKLPYHSAEVPWSRRRISGLAFLDTMPPYFEFALFTIGEGKADIAAKFEAKAEDGAGDQATGEGDEDGEFAQKYPKVHRKIKSLTEIVGKLMVAGMGKVDTIKQKPDPLPAEPKGSAEKQEAKMQMDPESAAKFASMASDITEMKVKFAKQEAEDKAKALVAKADHALLRKIVPGSLREQIVQFSGRAVAEKDGETWFEKFIESLKPSLRDKPTALGALSDIAAPAASSSDPVVAKFAKEDPDYMDEIGKFCDQWEQLKASLGERMNCPKEDFVKNELSLMKAKRAGSVNS